MIFKNLIKAREKQAKLAVDAYLAQYDDAQLQRMGVKRASLKTGGNVNFFM